MQQHRSETRPLAPASRNHHLDPDTMQRIVDRRVALKLGVSTPLGAAIAALIGAGPNNGRRP